MIEITTRNGNVFTTEEVAYTTEGDTEVGENWRPFHKVVFKVHDGKSVSVPWSSVDHIVEVQS